jgi:uncharacterized membrane protein
MANHRRRSVVVAGWRLRILVGAYSFSLAAVPTLVGLLIAGPIGALLGALAGATATALIPSPADRAAAHRIHDLEAELLRPESRSEQAERIRRDVRKLASMRRFGRISADE